ncbi:MAG: hypothetical protein KUG70_12085 [Rhodobacteraceae bacterium]|nr:hypothetical protein [Paracoccaceae bacterium]
MIDIRPDRAHPRGGFAELTLESDQIAGETAEVFLFDNYSERYLGEKGWQATRVMFGPYAIVREGTVARVIIGPEIVNQIDEYATVRLTVGDVSQDISWPEDIVPAPGAAKIGGITTGAPPPPVSETEQSPQLPSEKPIQQSATNPEPLTVPAEPEPTQQPDKDIQKDEPAKTNKALMWVIAVLIIAAIAAAVYFFVLKEPLPEEQPVKEPEIAVVQDTCGLEILRGLDGFAAQNAALRDCAGKVSADTALTLLEQGAAADDAEALRLFGVVYDSEVLDDTMETTIGLTFADAPATAADYYARSVAAGSQDAGENLSALCERMATMSDTLVRGSVADNCGQ